MIKLSQCNIGQIVADNSNYSELSDAEKKRCRIGHIIDLEIWDVDIVPSIKWVVSTWEPELIYSRAKEYLSIPE